MRFQIGHAVVVANWGSFEREAVGFVSSEVEKTPSLPRIIYEKTKWYESWKR
jgi:hypothetical protein